ncbi:pentatricopeptide repeat-containing protein At1g79540-like [Aristolochia californica]|uniref:pentatricopeptide repeat-containing protein At1g79540-like n=1 Tax=Aristolochia californica TaxID=171875 RepID=UPI0035E31845
MSRLRFAISKINSILSTAPLIESSLEFVVPLLSQNIVNLVIIQQRNVQLGFRFFIWAMKRREYRSWFSHNLMIDTLSKSHDTLEAAWTLLEHLRSSGILIVPQAFTVLISAYQKSGMVEKAIDSFGRMQEFGSRPNTFTYNTILQILIKQKVPQLAMAVYNQMLKSDCRPDRSTFGILIHGSCKAGRIEDALRLFDEMIQKGISPNTIIYTVVLSGHCQAKQIDEAYKLYYQMKKHECVPDTVTCNALLSGFCKVGRVDEAFDFVRKEGFGLELKAYSCLIDGLFRSGRFNEACDLYTEMTKKKIDPDQVMYTIMIKGYSEAGKVTEASKFLKEMEDCGYVPDTFCYNTLIKGYCDVGILDKARSLKLEISGKGGFPDSATYTILICGLCKEGLVSEAQEIFDEMEKHGCLPTVMTFNALIDGLCNNKQVDQAHIFLFKMEMGRKPSLFLRLSQGSDPMTNSEALQTRLQQLCETGHILKAYSLLQDLASSGVMPDVITYNILIKGLCKTKNINGAFKLFIEMKARGYAPDAVTYGTLIDGYFMANRESDAFHLFDNMAKNGLAPSKAIYNTLMKHMCQKGRVWRAFTLWVDYLGSSFEGQFDEFIGEAEKHFDDGSIGEVIRCLIQMDQLKVVDRSPFVMLLIGFCQAGKVDDAVKIFRVLQEYNIDITQRSWKYLINCLCQEAKVDVATDLLFYGMEKGFTVWPSLCNKLIIYLCYQNKKEGAAEIARRLKHAGYNMDLYLYQTTRALLLNDLPQG